MERERWISYNSWDDLVWDMESDLLSARLNLQSITSQLKMLYELSHEVVLTTAPISRYIEPQAGVGPRQRTLAVHVAMEQRREKLYEAAKHFSQILSGVIDELMEVSSPRTLDAPESDTDEASLEI